MAECSPAKLRGSFVGTVSQFGYQLGTLIAFWAGYGMSFHKSPYNIAWRVSNIIQVPIGLAFVVLSFWYPESPRWLLERYPDAPERCLANLAKIRSGAPGDENIRAEFHEMVASYEFRRRYEPGYMGLFKNRALRKRLLYGFYATALQQVGGIAAVTMYATLIYQSLGWDNGSQALAINGIQAVLQLFIVLVNTFTVDRFGRKALLMAGFAIQALALLVLSSLTTSYPDNTNKAAAVVEVAMLFVVGLTYCWSNGPIAPAIASEIFPQHVRDKAFGLSLLGQTVCLLALTQPWPRFNDEVGPKSYWLLFSLNVAALVSRSNQRFGVVMLTASRFPSYLSCPRPRALASSAWTRYSVRLMPCRQERRRWMERRTTQIHDSARRRALSRRARGRCTLIGLDPDVETNMFEMMTMKSSCVLKNLSGYRSSCNIIATLMTAPPPHR